MWPGPRLVHVAYLREHGPDAFREAGDSPLNVLPEPEDRGGAETSYSRTV
jgi:hypothetical protein